MKFLQLFYAMILLNVLDPMFRIARNVSECISCGGTDCGCHSLCPYCESEGYLMPYGLATSELRKEIFDIHCERLNIEQAYEEFYRFGSDLRGKRNYILNAIASNMILISDDDIIVGYEGLNPEWEDFVYPKQPEYDEELSRRYTEAVELNMCKTAKYIIEYAAENEISVMDLGNNQFVCQDGEILIPDWDDYRGYDVYTQVKEFGGDYSDLLD